MADSKPAGIQNIASLSASGIKLTGGRERIKEGRVRFRARATGERWRSREEELRSVLEWVSAGSHPERGYSVDEVTLEDALQGTGWALAEGGWADVSGASDPEHWLLKQMESQCGRLEVPGWYTNAAICMQRNNSSAESARGTVVHLYNVLKQRVQQAAQTQAAPSHRKAGRGSLPQHSPLPVRQVEDANSSNVPAGPCYPAPVQLQPQIYPGDSQHAHQSGPVKQPAQQQQQLVSPPSVNSKPSLESSPSDVEESASLADFYSIDWTPKEFYVKFRQQLNGYQVAANFEIQRFAKTGICDGTSSPHQVSLFGYQAHGCNTKLVLKPLGDDRMWKIICEPKQHDIRFLTKKIPVGPLFNLQLGVGHDYQSNVTGWTWKVTTSLGGSSASQVQRKTLFPMCPGLDFRIVWNAEYQFPAVHGGLGSGDPEVGMDLGHLYASVEKLEAIVTRCS